MTEEENGGLEGLRQQVAEAADDIAAWQERVRQATATLAELKKVDLIGPLTAEEWMEFRLRTEEDEEHELLRCCANTSAIRDDLFSLMRTYAEDKLLGRMYARRAWRAFVDHGLEDWTPRARELMERVRDYYVQPEDEAVPA